MIAPSHSHRFSTIHFVHKGVGVEFLWRSHWEFGNPEKKLRSFPAFASVVISSMALFLIGHFETSYLLISGC